MLKLCFIDTETTGLNSHTCGLYQVAGRIYAGESFKHEYDEGKDHKSFVIEVEPFTTDEINSVAKGMNEQRISKYTTPHLAISSSLAKLQLESIFKIFVNPFNRADKFFFVGYNAEFDYGFLRSLFEKCNDRFFGSFFFTPVIDVMGLAGFLCMSQRWRMDNFKLTTTARMLGVGVDESKCHDAVYDVELTVRIFEKILDIMNTMQGELREEVLSIPLHVMGIRVKS
jgi:DNA polymerase III subunit epsilon